MNSSFRSKFLFIAPMPLLFSGIGEMRRGDATGMLVEFGALVILLLAAWLLRDGLIAEAAYNERKVARPPAIPRKLFANGLTGLGVFIAGAFATGDGMMAALVFALIAMAAHAFSFGFDPMRKKGMEGMSEFETERVAKAVDKAEGILSETIAASRRIGDRRIESRVETLATSVREMFRAVEDDPRDLSGARKFLGVYLMGARDATIKFADLYSKRRDADAKTKYESLLTDLEASFNTQRETMMLDNRTDLDVEIEVLRDRLKQEGLKAR
ncbi:5-bromo-4-chloroindolyl phosphate hydrolysis family protein [Amylibacter sp. IMCC11727]|uniref:5-bromo-4-chloroindolyl phosphate hydrolysis family protein n=1 Tax=Amylibacter sp. IMCC11727 TaxID=3039851 RepID=UPI003266DA04